MGAQGPRLGCSLDQIPDRPVRLVVVLALLMCACSPRLTPPYRDFRVASPDTALTALLREAAVEAGWTLDASPAPSVITTATRIVGGTVTPTTVRLEIIPLAGNVVRVWVRGESRGVLGGRTKLYALTPSVRERALASLSDALRSRGLRALDTPQRRDEDATGG